MHTYIHTYIHIYIYHVLRQAHLRISYVKLSCEFLSCFIQFYNQNIGILLCILCIEHSVLLFQNAFSFELLLYIYSTIYIYFKTQLIKE